MITVVARKKAARAVTGGQALRSTFSSKTMTEYQSPAVTLLPPARCGVPDNIGVTGKPDIRPMETLEHYTLKTLNEKSIVIGREMR